MDIYLYLFAVILGYEAWHLLFRQEPCPGHSPRVVSGNYLWEAGNGSSDSDEVPVSFKLIETWSPSSLDPNGSRLCQFLQPTSQHVRGWIPVHFASMYTYHLHILHLPATATPYFCLLYPPASSSCIFVHLLHLPALLLYTYLDIYLPASWSSWQVLWPAEDLPALLVWGPVSLLHLRN